MDAYELVGLLPRPKGGFVLPSHRYTGPYNPLEKQLDKYDNPLPDQKPFNAVDRISLHHDICYRDGKESKRRCDDDMLKELDKLKPKNSREKFDKNLVRTVIGIKRKLDRPPPSHPSVLSKTLRGGGASPARVRSTMQEKDFKKPRRLAKDIFSLNKDVSERQNDVQNYVNNSNLYKKPELAAAPQTDAVKEFDLTNTENAYTDSLSVLDTNKVNLKANTELSFLPQQNKTAVLDDMPALALCMNNPYLMTMQTTRSMQETSSKDSHVENGDDNNDFLTILNDLKYLYTSSASQKSSVRSKKLDVLINFFSKFNKDNELQLDDKKCLTYRNINTAVKFSVYVDCFVKYPEETRSKTTFPTYFQELFLDKILNSQSRFSPAVYQPSSIGKRQKKKKTKKQQHRATGASTGQEKKTF